MMQCPDPYPLHHRRRRVQAPSGATEEASPLSWILATDEWLARSLVAERSAAMMIASPEIIASIVTDAAPAPCRGRVVLGEGAPASFVRLIC